MHSQQSPSVIGEVTHETLLERLGRIGGVALRAIAGLILLILAASPLMMLALATLRAAHG